MLNIMWSKPVKVEHGGRTVYQREWHIPNNLRSSFVEWWDKNNFKLIAGGFSIYNNSEADAVLFEQQKFKKNFKVFGAKKPDTKEPLIINKIQNTTGLRPWQADAVGDIVTYIKHQGCSIDGSDLGVGKTYTACGVARELDYNIVVICPKAVKEAWRRVICNHFKMEDKLLGITNYELLRTGNSKSTIASLVRNKITNKIEFVWKLPKNTLVVWDEAQKLKNWRTKSSEACLAALKQGYNMLFCSATMATNPLELKTVGSCLKLFANDYQYYKWAYDHGVVKGFFGMEFDKDKPQNSKYLKKLNKDVFGQCGVRLRRDTIPNFPESEITAECYNMDDEQTLAINQVYDEMKAELAVLKTRADKDGDDRSKLTIIGRAREKTELIKIPLLVDMVNEGIDNDMSVIIFLNYTNSIKALSERLNTKCIFDGKTKDAVRQQNVDNFQADKERIIIVNTQSGGAGLTLGDMTGKHPRLSLISPSYDPVHMRQCVGRAWRESSKTKSIQKIIFVTGTIEDKICSAVKQKLNNLDLLNDGDLLGSTGAC